MKLWRLLLRMGTLAVALLSGTLLGSCPMAGMYGPQPAYGVVPPPHDPQLVLEDFSFTPAQLQGGELLRITAHTNHSTIGVDMEARFAGPGGTACSAWLNDYGLPPDGVASDNVWHGELVWDSAQDPPGTYSVTLTLDWQDGWPGQQLTGPPLTVLPEQGQ